eukprot:10472872-Alexandrium_andersonii.AAC.2
MNPKLKTTHPAHRSGVRPLGFLGFLGRHQDSAAHVCLELKGAPPIVDVRVRLAALAVRHRVLVRRLRRRAHCLGGGGGLQRLTPRACT